MTSDRREPSPSQWEFWLDATAMLVPLFAFSMLETMLAPALPAIQLAVGASTADIGWVFSALLLVGAIATPIVGRLGDLYDKRKVMAATMGVAAVGVFLSSVATNIQILAIGQAVQGVALGSVPLAIGFMSERLPPDRVAAGNAAVFGVVSLSTAAGFLIVGVILDRFGFRALYWFPLAAVIPCVILLAWPRRALVVVTFAAVRFDWAGCAGLSIMVLCLLLGAHEMGVAGFIDRTSLALFVAAAVLLAGWVLVERRVAVPFFDVRLFQRRRVCATAGVAFCVGFGIVGLHVILPLMLQADSGSGIGFGASAQDVGFYMLPIGLGGVVAAPLIAPMRRVWGSCPVMIIGGVLLTLGVSLPGVLHAAGWQIFLATTCAGMGVAICLTEAMTIVVSEVPPERASSASGIVLLIRTLAGALGAQSAAAMLAAAADAGTGKIPAAGFLAVFTLLGGVTAVCIPVALAFYGSRRGMVRAAAASDPASSDLPM